MSAAKVNAYLAYSRGQLALLPCNECNHAYDRFGSAILFPDCVLLPNFWGFACASCIHKGRATDCSFHIYRKEYLSLWWNRIEEPKKLRAKSKWLERGHPLSKYYPKSSQKIWICRPKVGVDGDNKLEAPTQEPAFVFPPEISEARLPNGISALVVSLPKLSADRCTLSRASARIAGRTKEAERLETRQARVESRRERNKRRLR